THLEANRHFTRGLAALSGLPKGPAREGRETELQLARRLSLFTAAGVISAEAAGAYTRAPGPCEQRGEQRPPFPAVLGPLAIERWSRQACWRPQIVGPAATIDSGHGGRRIASTGPSQRLDHLFVCRRASGRPRALQGGAPAI